MSKPFLRDDASHELPSGVTHHHIVGRLHLAISNADETSASDARFAYFSVENQLSYVAYCDDFGPMSLGSVYEFCTIVDSQMARFPSIPIAMISRSDSRSLTNAVFLMGSYMIMRFGMSPNEVEPKFEDLSASLVSFRDVSMGPQNFELFVKDCWCGLSRAKSLNWVDFGPEGFDLSEYTHLDSPLNADLHEIVPGKFLAMRGPKDLRGGVPWEDIMSQSSGLFSHREFSPSHYVDILHQFDVQAVVRLNVAEYDRESFETNGIAVVDLWFEDCTTPPVDIVAKFMTIAEGLPGAIAVHCKAGLGRTGTLIALYMMKHHGFTAREAMGWIRIVRPGSIIGKQQQFLCEKEMLMRRAFAKFVSTGPSMVCTDRTVQGLDQFMNMVKESVDKSIKRVLLVDLPQSAGLGALLPDAGPVAEPDPNDCARKAPSEQLAEHVSVCSERRSSRRACLQTKSRLDQT